MQSNKAVLVIAAAGAAAALTFVILSSHPFKARSFDEAIERGRLEGLDKVAVVREGLPHFSAKSLDPVWDGKGGKAGLVMMPLVPLLDQEGKGLEELDFKGRITFLSFVFTSCAGVCPFLVANLKKIAEQNAGPEIQFLAITVDPEKDTPALLREYKKKMNLDSRWRLMTGDHEVIYNLIKKTFLSQAFQRTQGEERNFAHSEHFYVLDQDRYLRAVLNGTRFDVKDEAKALIQMLQRERSGVSRANATGEL